jgi:hypothetical protein
MFSTADSLQLDCVSVTSHSLSFAEWKVHSPLNLLPLCCDFHAEDIL